VQQGVPGGAEEEDSTVEGVFNGNIKAV
jgi:hypothetical protein